ncbi:hypothetical protein DL768_007325 [Monosporascus sp. mg162]|nr:hypothetical protein DL768_007325 [Monosporascus sp. mg162]
MKSITRKRLVSSCVPCYSKKQKCDRNYPCNRCTKRRRPDECAYHASQVNQDTSQTQRRQDPVHNNLARSENTVGLTVDPSRASSEPDVPASFSPQDLVALAERYGYFEDSESNTLAFIRKFGWGQEENQDDSGQPLTSDIADDVKRNLDCMPSRRVLDFLIQFFVAEVSWIDHLIYPPWFLGRYQQWWAKEQPSCVADVEFLVLVLRICSYSCQFLPSPYYTLDRISGILLTEIHKSCDEIGDDLAAIATRLDGRGSWVRVQHIAFLGLRLQSEGKMKASWEALSSAIRTAQSDGMHRGAATPGRRLDELEKEIRRRTYCNLYVWDSRLSRLLDREPFLPNGLCKDNWPRMRLVCARACSGDSLEGEADAPEDYTERLLHARMAAFWGRFHIGNRAEYDMIIAEDRYEQFCSEFLANLPPSFALQPNKTWDKRFPKLPLQRQLLYIAIFNSLCWNFRPLLLQGAYRIHSLPAYKRVLISSQRKALAVAALHVLDAVNTLHGLLGGSHTRFVGIIFPTFEAAVVLACLCIDAYFPGDDEEDDGNAPPPPGETKAAKTDPLRASTVDVTRTACVEAVQDALRRLRMLAEVSSMAEAGAHTLGRLFGKMKMATTTMDDDLPVGHKGGVEWPHFHQKLTPIDDAQVPSSWSLFESSNQGFLSGFVPVLEPNHFYYQNLETLSDLATPWSS